MISVGIDVHQKRCQACLKDQQGRLIEELNFQNNEKGIEQVKKLLASYPEASSLRIYTHCLAKSKRVFQ